VQDFTPLQVTEIIPSGAPDVPYNGDDLSSELKIILARHADLSGLLFTDAIGFTFTNGTRLAPCLFVLVRTPALATSVPGRGVSRACLSGLDNGERRLPSHAGSKVFFVQLRHPPWRSLPRAGFSLGVRHGSLIPASRRLAAERQPGRIAGRLNPGSLFQPSSSTRS
jgi:hypothetical protein